MNTNPIELPTYGAVRATYVTGRDRMYRRHTRHIPTDSQRAQWSAEFDAWADAIHAKAWDEAMQARAAWEQNQLYYVEDAPANPYRED